MAGAPSPLLEQPFVWKHSAFCVGVQLVEDMINCVNYLSELEDSPSESRLAFSRRRPIASENGMACVRSAGQRDLIAIWVVTPSAGERVFCSFQCTVFVLRYESLARRRKWRHDPSARAPRHVRATLREAQMPSGSTSVRATGSAESPPSSVLPPP